MNRQGRRLLLAAALVAGFGLFLTSAGQAAAAGPPTVLSLQLPEIAELGEEVAVVASLRTESGAPVGGTELVFSTPAEFGGVLGEMELGSHNVVTNADGTAILVYSPRRTGDVTLIVRFPGDSRYDASEGRAQITVNGSKQLYIEEAGLIIPFLSVVFLAGALAIVMSLYIAAALLVFAIAREGAVAEGEAGYE